MNFTVTEELLTQLPNEQELRKMKKEEYGELIKTLILTLEDNGFNITSCSLWKANKMLKKKKITQEQFNNLVKLKKYFYMSCEIHEKFIPLKFPLKKPLKLY